VTACCATATYSLNEQKANKLRVIVCKCVHDCGETVQVTASAAAKLGQVNGMGGPAPEHDQYAGAHFRAGKNPLFGCGVGRLNRIDSIAGVLQEVHAFQLSHIGGGRF
jgi:hypothetical protein